MKNKTPKSIDLSKAIDKTVNGVAIERTVNSTDDNHGLFLIKTANKWNEEARSRPIPKMLFAQLWYEGELCILFADTNLGKSILAVQIGNSISKGEEIKNFAIETVKQPVLYFDFELSDKQFQNRYSKDYTDNYDFDDNFLRVEINPDLELPKDVAFDDYLILSIEKSILSSNAKVLIIDNLTYLKNDNEKAKEASPLMKKLKEFKSKYSLSILILAHTPKRDLSKPISKNDLAGSKALMNFCDSSFTIGESNQDKQIRYIKQIKQRNCEQVFDADNVCVCQISKEYNFLQFEFVSLGNEREHLKQYTEKDRNNVITQVKELSQQGKSQRDIASELGIGASTVNKYLKL